MDAFLRDHPSPPDAPEDRILIPTGVFIQSPGFTSASDVNITGYIWQNYDTNFGIEDYIGQTQFPQLYFSVTVSRNFINAFVMNLVPLLVVAALLYSILLITTADPNRSERFGFPTAGAIGTASALFFVVMLAHIQLRAKFAGSGIFYLVEFYLTLYIVILPVSTNIYIFSREDTRRRYAFIHYKDNAIVKMAYWPLILSALAIITMVGF